MSPIPPQFLKHAKKKGQEGDDEKESFDSPALKKKKKKGKGGNPFSRNAKRDMLIKSAKGDE